jgi:hypothetical protein
MTSGREDSRRWLRTFDAFPHAPPTRPPLLHSTRVTVHDDARPSSCCGIGSWGGQCPSLGVISGCAPPDGATPTSGVPDAPLCWLRSGVEYLVSGDDDLLMIRQYRDVTIVDARHFLGLLSDPRR